MPKQQPLRAADLVDPSGRVGAIAAYVEVARGKRAAEPARQAAFKCIFDLLGSAWAGIGEPGLVSVRSMAATTLGTGKVPIWFSGISGSVIGAAWANSSAAAALDLDDGNRLACGHPDGLCGCRRDRRLT